MIDRTTPPPLSTFGDLSLNFPAVTHLPNGIPCWIINGGDDDMNRVNIYFKGGSFMEDLPGQAILTAYMLTEGNSCMPPEQVAEMFDFYAARKSCDSYDYWSEVVMTSLNDNFAHTMPLLFQCITSPSFPEQALETLKRRLAGNLGVMQQRVKYLAAVRMKELYYGDNHPLGKNLTPDHIMGITRDDLLAFHNRFYHPANCCMIISGKVDDKVMATINSTIGAWTTTAQEEPFPAWTISPSPIMLDIVDKPGAMQSALRLRIEAVKRNHPDYLPLRILVMAFGGYFGSRLMSNIREDKGYTYGIGAALLGIENDGCVDIQCECATQHTWNVIKEIKHEMKRLRDELIPLDELDTVKQHMLSAAAKTHDSPYNIASYVSSTILFGVYPEYHNRQLDCIRNITPQQLQTIARRYLTDERLRTTIAGDKTQLNSLL